MAHLIPNELQTFSFDSSQEELRAHILTEGNVQFIRNELAARLLERAQLSFDPEHPTLFTQQEASLMGHVQAYRWILECHEEALKAALQAQNPDDSLSDSF